MSDGLTDIARDERRIAAIEGYLSALADWLEHPGDDRAAAVRRAAEEADSIRRGYWSGRTSVLPGLETRMEALRAGDRTAWDSLLWLIEDAGTEAADRLRRLAGRYVQPQEERKRRTDG